MLNVKYIVDLNENNALGLRLNDENLGMHGLLKI